MAPGGECREQCGVAEDVDDARDPMAQLCDARERIGREDVARRGAGLLEAGPDVERHLRRRERAEANAERDALPELAEARIGEDRVELGLAREHDLEDLLARRLEVREQAQLLEYLRAHVLRLVDQERDVAAGARVLDQELVQPLEQDALPAALRWDAELDQDVLEDLLEADGRVEEKDRLRVRRDGVEEPAEEGGLPGPRLPDEGDEPLACVDPVAESRQRLLIVVIQIEEARVGRDVEG